ncbi:amidohydrolase [Mesorhizobium sp. ASY16-5R]|uniref:amidohydrolase n=1 Tax=Mesorhizobium sp. ASY16-5R TaxID=3445772 RepID=UPI003F9EF12E
MSSSPLDNSLVEEATGWRRHLHAHPETAFDEHRTADFVAEKLEEFGIAVHRGLGGTGVVGTLKRGNSPVAVGLRADMDALFIHEESAVGYRSSVDGKMHACGHDGHMAMLLGAAKHLAKNGDFDGTVHFIFQPAEETGDERCGGNLMVKDGLFERFPVQAVFGLHNLPSAPLGSFSMRPGPMLASIDTFEFRIGSVLAHPATQYGVADPLLIAADIVQDMHAFKARYVNPAEPVVLSITQFQSGNPADRQSVHVTPDKAVVRGTVYTLNDAVRDQFEAGLERLVRNAAEAGGASHEFLFQRGYPVLRNTADETEFAKNVAQEVSASVNAAMQPVMGAEDFAFMLGAAPGCYVFLGSLDEGEAAPRQLHNPRYDFNDAVLPVGIRYWATLAERYLGETGSGRRQ